MFLSSLRLRVPLSSSWVSIAPRHYRASRYMIARFDSVVCGSIAVPRYNLVKVGAFANVTHDVDNSIFLRRFAGLFSPSTNSSLFLSSLHPLLSVLFMLAGGPVYYLVSCAFCHCAYCLWAYYLWAYCCNLRVFDLCCRCACKFLLFRIAYLYLLSALRSCIYCSTLRAFPLHSLAFQPLSFRFACLLILHFRILHYFSLRSSYIRSVAFLLIPNCRILGSVAVCLSFESTFPWRQSVICLYCNCWYRPLLLEWWSVLSPMLRPRSKQYLIYHFYQWVLYFAKIRRFWLGQFWRN